MAFIIPEVPDLIRNSIGHQNKRGKHTLSTSEWNDIINTLAAQTNANTRYLTSLHTSLWGNRTITLQKSLVNMAASGGSGSGDFGPPPLPSPSPTPPPPTPEDDLTGEGSTMWLEPIEDLEIDLDFLD